MDDITETALKECCALVKANSIDGNKAPNVDVVYTRWKNLNKAGCEKPGQVGFHRPDNVRKVKNVERDTSITNRLNKTKREPADIDLAAEQQERARETQREMKEQKKEQTRHEESQRKAREEEKKLKSYDSMFKDGKKMTSNADVTATADASASVEYEEDFM